MERLTMRNSDGTVSQPTKTTVEDVFYRLAYYEDMEEQGRLVVLPCKVGETVYILPMGLGIEGDFITEAEVLSISSDNAMFRVKYPSGQLDRYTWSSIGKTVFLTREEAEQALRCEHEEST